MSIKSVKVVAIALCSAMALSNASWALAQEAKTLDELLGFVKKGQVTESRENREREQRFSKDKANQASALASAKAERARQEALSTQLEDTYEVNELELAAKQELLKEKLGTLAELFGHLTSTAGDLSANMEQSLISAQYPGREVFLQDLIKKMSGSDKLPSGPRANPMKRLNSIKTPSIPIFAKTHDIPIPTTPRITTTHFAMPNL